MDWLEQLKKSKLFRAVTWIAGTVIALGAVAGAINSLIELFNRGWLDGAEGWYAAATGWLSYSISVPVWLLTPVIAIATLAALSLIRTTPSAVEPSAKPNLTHSEAAVLNELMYSYHENVQPTLAGLQNRLGFGKLETECAVEVLAQEGLISWDQNLFESDDYRAELTAKGRAYLLSLTKSE
jgi:hypothetical protein